MDPKINSDPWILARNGDLDSLKAFIDKNGFEIDSEDVYGCSCMFYACKNGHIEIFRYLIEKGADYEKPGLNGLRPLHIVIKNLHQHILQELIALKCNINSLDAHDNNALHFAAEKGVLGQLELLIKNGCNTKQVNNYGFTALDRAINENHTAIISKLSE